MQKNFYSVKDFVNVIGKENMSKPNVYKLITKGKIPVVYLGNRPLIPAAWVENFLKNSVEN